MLFEIIFLKKHVIDFSSLKRSIMAPFFSLSVLEKLFLKKFALSVHTNAGFGFV
jgi:hypothetical protein